MLWHAWRSLQEEHFLREGKTEVGLHDQMHGRTTVHPSHLPCPVRSWRKREWRVAYSSSADHSKTRLRSREPTLRTPWSWQNIVSNTAPERGVLSVLSLGVALRTDQSGASEGAETCTFLASILLAFASHVVLFWLWLPRRGRWTAPVAIEIQRKMWEMLGISSLKGYQVEALDAVYMPQQTRYAGVCVDWEQKLCVFRSRPNPHRHGQRHWQWASSLVRRLWLARFVSDWKAPPGDVTARTD